MNLFLEIFVLISNFYLIFSYPLAIQLVSTGRLNVKPLITHRFKLEEAIKAFEVARTGADGAIKVHIECANEKSIYFSWKFQKFKKTFIH